jgi:hypothetical protein
VAGLRPHEYMDNVETHLSHTTIGRWKRIQLVGLQCFLVLVVCVSWSLDVDNKEWFSGSATLIHNGPLYRPPILPMLPQQQSSLPPKWYGTVRTLTQVKPLYPLITILAACQSWNSTRSTRQLSRWPEPPKRRNQILKTCVSGHDRETHLEVALQCNLRRTWIRAKCKGFVT